VIPGHDGKLEAARLTALQLRQDDGDVQPFRELHGSPANSTTRSPPCSAQGPTLASSTQVASNFSASRAIKTDVEGWGDCTAV